MASNSHALPSQRLSECISLIISVTDRTPGRRIAQSGSVLGLIDWITVFIKFANGFQVVWKFVPSVDSTQSPTRSCAGIEGFLMRHPGSGSRNRGASQARAEAQRLPGGHGVAENVRFKSFGYVAVARVEKQRRLEDRLQGRLDQSEHDKIDHG